MATTIEPFLNILFIIQPFLMIISKRDWIKKEEDIFSNLQIVEKFFYSLFVLVINFRKIRMRISTKNTRKKMYNVFGIIRGSIEPGFLLGRDSIKIIRLIGSIVNWFLNWYIYILFIFYLFVKVVIRQVCVAWKPFRRLGVRRHWPV